MGRLRLLRRRRLIAAAALSVTLTAVVPDLASNRGTATIEERESGGLVSKPNPLTEHVADTPDTKKSELSSPGPEPAIVSPATITNSIGTRFNLIPAGEFLMGSANDDQMPILPKDPASRAN